jgi:hypothetical protein
MYSRIGLVAAAGAVAPWCALAGLAKEGKKRTSSPRLTKNKSHRRFAFNMLSSPIANGRFPDAKPWPSAVHKRFILSPSRKLLHPNPIHLF